MTKEIKRIMLVANNNAFREALAAVLSQEADLEVAWQAGSIAGTRDLHLNGIDLAIIDPLLPDGDGMELVREVSVANPTAVALVLSRKGDSGVYHRALGAGAAEVLGPHTSLQEVINTVKRLASAE